MRGLRRFGLVVVCAATSACGGAAKNTAGTGGGGANPVEEYCVSGDSLALHFVNDTSDWVIRLTR